MHIRLIYRPGVFLYFVNFVNEGKDIQFTTSKDIAKKYDIRDNAIDDIKTINEITKYYYNLEIINF